MTKSSETYRKVAETAKNNEGGHYYDKARTGYETARMAEEKARSLDK